MAGNGDLLRSMRAGGGAALAAAQELMRRAQAGAVSPQELSEVQKLVTSPELKDAFAGMANELTALLSKGGDAVFRDVSALTPDTSQLTDAGALPERFLADFTLVQGELMNHPGMTRQQKAARAFAFFQAYATRFHELAKGTAQAKQPLTAAAPQGLYGAVEVPAPLAPALSDAALAKGLARFDKALTRVGFHEVRSADGRTGLELARELLQGREVKPGPLDAPAWKDNAALAAEVARNRQAAAVDVKPVILPHVKAPAQAAASAKPDEAAPKRPSRRSDRVLGGRMLWNALHLLRGEELDDVAKKDAMTQLAIAAGLLLGFIAIVVGLLVWM